MSLRRSAALAAGLATLTLAAVAFAYQGQAIRDGWANMGPLAPGKEVPAFRGRTLAGERFDNGSLEGKVTVLVFWTTWCGVCKSELPEISELSTAYGETHGDRVQVFGVNADREVDQVSAVTKYAADNELALPMLLDSGRIGQAFRVHVFPHTVILDGEGNLRHVHEGRVRRSRIEGELDALLAEG